MSTSAIDLLENEIAQQSLLVPPPEDENEWLTRYLFNPFKDHLLDPQYQAHYGLTRFRRGIIQPIRRVNKQEPNYQIIKSFDDNDLTPKGTGVSEMRIDRRPPLKIVNAMLREYQHYRGIKTGVTHLTCLDGEDDANLARSLQVHYLPVVCETLAEQMQRIEAGIESAPNALFGKVGETLMAASEANQGFCEWYYDDLLGQVEAVGQGFPGKAKLSDLDRYICQWIGAPLPRLQSKLDIKPVQPTIDVQSIVGQVMSAVAAAQAVTAQAAPMPVSPSPDVEEFDRVTGKRETLEQKQTRMRTEQESRKGK